MEQYQGLAKRAEAALVVPQDPKSQTQTITDYVNAYRIKHNITPTPGRKLEFSCYAIGEGTNLLYRQLVPTINGDGDWPSLQDGEIRKLVLEQIAKDRSTLK